MPVTKVEPGYPLPRTSSWCGNSLGTATALPFIFFVNWCSHTANNDSIAVNDKADSRGLTRCMEGLSTSKREVNWASWTPTIRFESGTSLMGSRCANCYIATFDTLIGSRMFRIWISNWYRFHLVLAFNPYHAGVFGENMIFYYAFLIIYKFSLSCTANFYVKLSTSDRIELNINTEQGRVSRPHISFIV